MAKSKQQRILSIDEQINQLEAQRKQLIRRQKAEARMSRSKRQCKRHNYIEKCLPDIVNVTDKQFEVFVDRVINTGHAKETLAQIISGA